MLLVDMLCLTHKISDRLPVLKFLDCPAPQLTPYGQYLSEGSPYATQHGVKGAQFDRVLVVMDEEENDYRLYDYEKVLGDAKASAADRAAFADGEDNTWSRTLRLLYVCATRAKRGLAMVFFVENPGTTVSHIVASGIFPEGSVITQDELTRVEGAHWTPSMIGPTCGAPSFEHPWPTVHSPSRRQIFESG